MKQALKDQWTAALRGGEYEQGRGRLYGEGKFCCLGVLCRVVLSIFDFDRMDTETAELPDFIEGEAELGDGWCLTLANYNDGTNTRNKLSFSQIADVIDYCVEAHD